MASSLIFSSSTSSTSSTAPSSPSSTASNIDLSQQLVFAYSFALAEHTRRQLRDAYRQAELAAAERAKRGVPVSMKMPIIPPPPNATGTIVAGATTTGRSITTTTTTMRAH
ncbi:uncharacterized protein EI90DRAFT_3119635 [Cantharellus anzutake]|uniref:uncharacterized protein n=1 Tax=Cantharellus anzutake TaxID=1750568 RepID=UPI001905DB94|nr:uncharacterized protein EI90DRAFT_3119635 [Cantharellus anzutake]KAF8336342.1 hypothetical protein EI90DRAFT_3119635 [Cantharellus anzutake]